MAARISASGQSLSRTANLPTIAAFTIMGWFRFASLPGASVWATPFAIGNSSGSVFYSPQITSVGGIVHIDLWNGFASATGSSAIVANTWYHVALTCSGTGVGQLLAYLNGVLEVTYDGNASVAAQSLFAGNNSLDERIDGRVAYVKAWSAALTAAEIAIEKESIAPVRLANLNSASPIFAGATERVLNLSGVAGNWTANGTLTDEDPPPVTWRGRRKLIAFVPAGGPPPPVTPTRRGVFDRYGQLVPEGWFDAA